MTKLCLALEAFRRTDEGRIRDAKAFLTHFFPQDKQGATDRIFHHIPNEVRADLLSNWGIRGKKSALRDDDDRVRNTVNDALNAGDIDPTVIEEGITPEILTDWVPLEDWWVFWRGANLPIGSVRKALALARDLSLFDERWFFEHLALKSAKLVGTDVVCAALSKEQIVAWMHAVHTSGDASPTGLVAALGWETILAKTAHEGLLYALDALARQIGLAETSPEDRKSEIPRAMSAPPPPHPLSDLPPTSEPPTKPTQTIPEATSPRAKSEPPPTPPPVIPEPPPTPRTGLGGAQEKGLGQEKEIPARISEPEPAMAAATEAPPRLPTPAPPPPPEPTPISRPPVAHSPLPKPSVPPPKPPPPPGAAKPPVPASTKITDSAASKAPPVSQQKPPVPASKAPPVPQQQQKPPPPVPAAASKAPNAPPSGKPPPRSVAPPVQDLPSVIIEENPVFPAAPVVSPSAVPSPPSAPPNARALFLGAAADPPPMRPPAATIVGVAPQGSYGLASTDELAMPNFTMPPSDPSWAPQRAEPGDMGWDLIHGVTRPMGTNVQPKYNFEDDDEPTSEINLPTDIRRQ